MVRNDLGKWGENPLRIVQKTLNFGDDSIEFGLTGTKTQAAVRAFGFVS